MRIIYFDVDSLMYEGFRSGALIHTREMLKRFNEKQFECHIVACSRVKDSNLSRASQKVLVPSTDIDVSIEHLSLLEDKESLELVTATLERLSPDVIMLHAPSVYLDYLDVHVIEEAIRICNRVIVKVNDPLYPSLEFGRDPQLVSRYLDAVRKTKLMVMSDFMADIVKRNIGISATVIQALFSLDEVVAQERQQSLKEYITLVNPIPVKGVDIFEAVAKGMPLHKFLAVRGWADSDAYVPAHSNIEVLPFQQHSREIWKRTRILLVPSLWQEAFGRVIVEALLNRTIVIAHDVGGIRQAGMNQVVLIDPPKLSGSQIDPTIRSDILYRHARVLINTILNVESNPEAIRMLLDTGCQAALEFCRRSESQFEEWVAELRG